MKLFTRYTRINLVSTIIIFILSGVSFFFLLRYILINQVDDDLRIEQHEIENYVKKYNRLPEIIAVKDQQTEYKRVEAPGGRGSFETVQVMEHRHKEYYRQLGFYLQVNGSWNNIRVSKSLEGTDNITQSIVSITLITILLILAVAAIINRLVLRKLWQPFYATLAVMRGFELEKKSQLVFPETSIDEFRLMNETLRQSTAKADQDYQLLKEFTENASHELQTPVSVIQSKLDVLIQDEQLSEAQSRAVQSAYAAIQRLSRLNQGLLLLTKIENGQFADTSPVNIAEKITEKIIHLEEMITAKKILISCELAEPLYFNINPALADIMLNNLLSNAIRYNVENGEIEITTTSGKLQIVNTGGLNALDEKKLFSRFSKPGMSQEGIGLGLAIVQQVAAVSGLKAAYAFTSDRHRFSIGNNHHRQ